MPRFFTPQEANETLGAVRPIMDEILLIRADLLVRQPELWPSIQRSVGNGGSARLSKLYVDFERLDKLVHRLQDLGVLVKDLNTGLVDFPALHNDHEVYLCWKYDEERVEFWHEIEDGFAGRQVIDWE